MSHLRLVELRRTKHGKYGDEWCFAYVRHWHIGRWIIWSR